MSQENRGENLYTRIYRLLVTEQYAEAEQVLDEHLLLDPSSREAILSWTELKLVQGQTDAAIERLAPLTISFPTDPYFMLAAAEVVLQEAYVTPTGVTDLLDGVAACAGDSSDVLAKIGFAAAMRGCWSYGMRFFIKAMRARDRINVTGAEDLILLWKSNQTSLDVYLHSLVALNGRGWDGDSLDDLPLEMLVRTVCILLLARTEAGISEAWPVALRLACNHRELLEAWSKKNFVPLFSRFCLNWIGIETKGGGRIGAWSAN
jgi:hypothetical protein